MAVSLLSVNRLSYHAADRTLLDDVTFDLNFGQKVALVGRSGSGKSVLLQALADLLPLDNAVTDRIMLNKNGKLTSLSQIPPHPIIALPLPYFIKRPVYRTARCLTI
ncbi:Hemin import ATP-binding protein HmuV [Moraxella ovis]|uniref:Hemin import ATP-binding protein HmuV n=1 Tax=Moraxella ovis TaxID=29433 RepID=A0A378PM03_9GAMM|nr:ATP-binding cassette domain-containing protein [Moraxella ovis]STY87150.1 Hemin import ATP-binding protein HmuV [Moraxella ovis]